MIHTTVQDLARYESVHPRLKQAAQALYRLQAMPFQAGRHEVDGENLYINAIEYDTKPVESSMLEAHRMYLDVMLLLEGEEQIAYCDLADAGSITKPYEAAGDALLAEIPGQVSLEWMRPGDVVILFPEDCHAPGIDTGGTHTVQKLIAKVRI